MLYHEITASSLAKVDMQGSVVEKGTTNYGVNRDSFQLHSAIHAARPDIKCIIHIHTNSVLAVSSLKCGLLPLCQESCVIGEVSSHQYQGGLFEPEERDKISRNLGPNNKVLQYNLILHNNIESILLLSIYTLTIAFLGNVPDKSWCYVLRRNC